LGRVFSRLWLFRACISELVAAFAVAPVFYQGVAKVPGHSIAQCSLLAFQSFSS